MAEPVTTTGLGLLYKILGATVGSSLAITILVPDHHRDAAVRFAFGLVLGVVFGPAAYNVMAPYIGDSGEAWNMLTGSTAAGFVAWSVASVVAKAIKRWQSPYDILHSLDKPEPEKDSTPNKYEG